MSPKAKKFISYYKPYKGLFFADMFFAIMAAAITLVYPMIVRYITNTVLVQYEMNEALQIIIKLTLVMIGLIIVEFICKFFINYQGHVMGAKMEHDMRNGATSFCVK